MSLTIHLFIVILDTVKGMLVQLSPAIGGSNVPDIPRDNETSSDKSGRKHYIFKFNKEKGKHLSKI
jgi:hypothetical protein